MKKEHFFKLICVVIIFTFLCACEKQGEAEDLTKTYSEDGVEVSFSTDKSEYKAGESITFTINIENKRSYWRIAKGSFSYLLSDGLSFAEGEEFNNGYDVIDCGKSFTITGSLSGDPEKIKEGASLKNNTFGETKKPSSNDAGVVTVKPYTSIKYNGCDVSLKFTFEFAMYQNPTDFSSSAKNNAKTVTCHDPSIFVDKDGSYYVFGTHLGMGISEDLRNWVSKESAFRASFTSEVIEKIREWNRDSGSWYGYLWAPDVIYNEAMGKYCMYLSANGDDWVSNIVLLTADKAEGPYDYAGSVIYGGFTEETYSLTDVEKVTGEKTIPQRYVTNGVVNRKWGDEYPNVIDPCVFYDDEGKLWMSYGSWSGGIFIIELDEKTGLRDYSVSYATNDHSDAYFGKKIAGGKYVSGEGSYIQKIGDYYYLFISYGGLEAAAGYNMRYFRSERPDGNYVDALGNTAYYDKYIQNFNDSRGIRIFGSYKWRNMTYAQVAQGHNSAFVDSDGKAYLVFHTRTSNGSEGHFVKVHQLFTNEDGWLVAAPYATDGETLNAGDNTAENLAGEYEIITHELALNYKNYESNKTEVINLNTDGSVTDAAGEKIGSFECVSGTSYFHITIGEELYKGVALKMNVENYKVETTVFTVLGDTDQITLWGSKTVK
ncbi:MAG: glycoside hydrolase family 43 protein [Lachnospiraceae bacterium]|nr:glycoside hydrolase family 43 protein [Lachnospiraceae bacterium]